MAVFRVERTGDYTVMSNFHLKDKRLSLKAKGLLSQMLSLPDDWDYTLSGLSYINRESKDAIRSAVNELETAGYIRRRQTTDASGKFAATMSLGIEYSVYSNIASSAKKSEEFDFIIVDTDSTFDEDKAALLGLSDKVIIVTAQSLMSVTATNRLVFNINNIETDKYLFVCNDFSKDEDNYLISPDVPMKFTVSEYIEHFAHCEKMSIAELSKKTSIQKAAFLVI